MIAFGRRVSPAFRARVIAIAMHLGCDPSHLMAAMAFETGETFSPSIRNRLSGATGLIQFMPRTAAALGTSTDALAAMSAVEQLGFVARYLAAYRGRLITLSDCYMSILWPAAIGRPEGHALFRAGTKAYEQNKGLDADRDGVITKAEAAAKVHAKLVKGMRPENRG